MTRIPLLAICCVTLFVMVAEKACGTDTWFVAGVGVTFLAIGLTFNLLGGLTTISGILFTETALRNIVISQFLKIFYREPADLNLEAAHLTITVYAVFFCCLALASVFFGRLRLPLPRPVEPRTESQRRLLYLLSLAGGIIGTALVFVQQLNPGTRLTLSHSIGLILSGLLLFSLVLAIDERIRITAGEHSIGWAVVIPAAVTLAEALVTTSREVVAAPVFLYYFICYTRGYRFRRRHALALIGFVLFFFFVYSPFELYSRGFLSGQDLSQRVTGAVQILKAPPKFEALAAVSEDYAYEGRHGYFNATHNDALKRLGDIWFDSTLISATASGFHYGWTPIRMDLAYSVPRFINPNKSGEDSSLYIGDASGMNTSNPDDDDYLSFSPIGPTFGSFGMTGVVVLGLCVVPLFFAIYRSVFDVTTVWGTVALALLLPTFGEWRPSEFITSMTYQVAYLILLSWVLGIITNLLPSRLQPPMPSLPAAPIQRQPTSVS